VKYDVVVTVRIQGNGTDRHDLIELDPLLKFLEVKYPTAKAEFHREANVKTTLETLFWHSPIEWQKPFRKKSRQTSRHPQLYRDPWIGVDEK